MPESAFKGTVLEGRERRYTVLNERDISKYGSEKEVDDLNSALYNVLADVEKGRQKEDKKPYNSYIVINIDEPYADEVIEIMKRHGHFR
jgi:hypothetical protein